VSAHHTTHGGVSTTRTHNTLLTVAAVAVGRRADLGVLMVAPPLETPPEATGVCGGAAGAAAVAWPLLVEACRGRVCTGVESAEIGAAARIADRCSM
jgi:hypothetical protein